MAMDTWETVIATNNALAKMAQYGLSQSGVMDAFNRPDRIEWSKTPNCKNYIRNYKDYEIGVVARQKNDGTWIIVSCWYRKLYK